MSRRRWLATLLGSAGTFAVAACDRAVQNQRIDNVQRSAEKLTLASQRLLLDRQPLAKEYAESELSPVYRADQF